MSDTMSIKELQMQEKHQIQSNLKIPSKPLKKVTLSRYVVYSVSFYIINVKASIVMILWTYS